MVSDMNKPSMVINIKAYTHSCSTVFRTATQILSAVQRALSAHTASHVTIVGHSLGGEIAHDIQQVPYKF